MNEMIEQMMATKDTHKYALAQVEAGKFKVIALTKDGRLTDCFNTPPYPAIGSAISQEVTYKREPCCLSCPHATLVQSLDGKEMYYQITCSGTEVKFKLSAPDKNQQSTETPASVIQM